MLAIKKIFLFLIILFLYQSNGYSQESVTIRQLQKQYGGTWIDRKTTRCLQITFDNERFATIMDWTRKYQSRESGDVYKAYIKKDTLVMLEDKEHHAPYSEITIENNKLIYRTKSSGILKVSIWDTQVFTRK
jgi:hypothetical protein